MVTALRKREVERSAKPVIKKKKLFPMEHVSFRTKTAKSPMSAKVKTENDANNISPLGHSTGTQIVQESKPGSKSVGIFPQESREL